MTRTARIQIALMCLIAGLSGGAEASLAAPRQRVTREIVVTEAMVRTRTLVDQEIQRAELGETFETNLADGPGPVNIRHKPSGFTAPLLSVDRFEFDGSSGFRTYTLGRAQAPTARTSEQISFHRMDEATSVDTAYAAILPSIQAISRDQIEAWDTGIGVGSQTFPMRASCHSTYQPDAVICVFAVELHGWIASGTITGDNFEVPLAPKPGEPDKPRMYEVPFNVIFTALMRKAVSPPTKPAD
jgi:hypothetical protein